jgi:hypothetical protein
VIGVDGRSEFLDCPRNILGRPFHIFILMNRLFIVVGTITRFPVRVRKNDANSKSSRSTETPKTNPANPAPLASNSPPIFSQNHSYFRVSFQLIDGPSLDLSRTVHFDYDFMDWHFGIAWSSPITPQVVSRQHIAGETCELLRQGQFQIPSYVQVWALSAQRMLPRGPAFFLV